jgi:hypothetical protein
MKFIRSDHRLLWAVAHDREPNGREGQSSWATAVEVYSLCATAAGSTAVGPQQQGSANAMHHGGRSPERENCVKNDQNKLEKNIFSGGPTNQPLRGHFSHKIATLRTPWGWNPNHLQRVKPPLQLHYIITCVHTQFLFSSYYT